MTLAECIAEARRLFAEGKTRCAFRALDLACAGDGALLATALEFLDGLTPDRWTFLLWIDGAVDVVEAGEWVGVSYRYDRPKTDVLALMGRAALKAARQEAA